MPGVSIIDPPPPPSGTSLIFDVSSFSDTRLYRPEDGRDRPTYTIRSKNDGRHRFVHRGLDGPIVGEIVLHGTFKRGQGSVTISGTDAVTIEDWMTKKPEGREVVIQDVSYVWSKNPIQRGNKAQSRYEARRGNEIVMTYIGPTQDHTFSTWNGNSGGTGSTTHITRAHLTIADSLENETIASTLLLSLILFNHLEATKGPGMDFGLIGFMTSGFQF